LASRRVGTDSRYLKQDHIALTMLFQGHFLVDIESCFSYASPKGPEACSTIIKEELPMKNKLMLVALAALVLGVFASCTTVSFEGLQMQKDLQNYTVVKNFKKTITDPRVIGYGTSWALIGLTRPDKVIFDTIRSEINKVSGDAAIDVTISYGSSLVDMLLNSFTAGLYSPRTITISGTIVKINK
jgi:hypothetical protein